MAVLAISGISYLLIPKLGLICNLLVVSGGCWHYYKNGHFNHKLIWPFVLTSVPLAFLGGMYPMREKTFMLLLGSSLFLAGLRLLFVSRPQISEVSPPGLVISSLVGALLGFLSGLVALGGGIFLSPLMLNLKWGLPKEVAATASAFIFFNSAAGLAGQLTKGGAEDFLSFWPLFVAVFLGGQIGSRIGTHPLLPQHLVQRGTAVLILIISSRLLLKLFF